jgi:hypothetical protein
MPDYGPPELGNEDEEFLALLDCSAGLAGTVVCRCSHLEVEHPGGECIRPLCGCTVFRPDVSYGRNTASRARKSPAAGRGGS